MIKQWHKVTNLLITHIYDLTFSFDELVTLQAYAMRVRQTVEGLGG